VVAAIAAVIGTEVPFSLLQEIADRSNEDLRRALSHLCAAELLYESQLFPDLEFSFCHALTHDVAYSGLLQNAGARCTRASSTRSNACTRTGYQSTSSDWLTTRSEGEVWLKGVPTPAGRNEGSRAVRAPRGCDVA
jgi:hypothetical protein